MIGNRRYEASAPEAGIGNSCGNCRRIVLVHERAMHRDRGIQRRGNPPEGLGEAGEESRLRTHEDNLDPEKPPVRFGKTPRIVEGSRRGDDLLHRFRAHTAAPVHHTFDGRRPDAGLAGNILKGRLGDRSLQHS